MHVVRLILIGLSLAWLTGGCRPASVDAQPITMDHASTLLQQVEQKEWLLIDVRSPQEYAQGHIPGALNMPHDRIDDYLAQLGDAKHKPIIVYCQSGRRARMVMDTLRMQAFKDVSHLEGDMMGWRDAGMPINRM